MASRNICTTLGMCDSYYSMWLDKHARKYEICKWTHMWLWRDEKNQFKWKQHAYIRVRCKKYTRENPASMIKKTKKNTNLFTLACARCKLCVCVCLIRTEWTWWTIIWTILWWWRWKYADIYTKCWNETKTKQFRTKNTRRSSDR